MPQDQKAIHVTCLCGRFRASAYIPLSSLPLPGNICHCYACRHISGSLGSTHLKWPSNYPDFSLLSRGEFSARVWVYFCGNCGSYMFWRHHESPRRLVMSIGLLEESDEIVDINCHIWVMGSKDGGLADFLPVVGGRPLPRWIAGAEANPVDLSGLLPLGWKLHPDVNHHETILPAKCFCGGVQFHITRPSEGPPSHDGFGNEWWLSSNNRFPAGICVCRSCRLAAGTDAMPWAWIATDHVKMIDGSDYKSVFGTMKWYRSSDEAMRSFCSGCGATIFYARDSRMRNDNNGMLNVAVGLFNATGGARADEWLVWMTHGLYHEYDAANTRLAQALKAGIRSWGLRNYENHPLGSEEGWQQMMARLFPEPSEH